MFRTRRLRRTAPVAAALAVMVVSGCSTDSASERATAPGEKPSTLTLAVGDEPDDGFDPTTGWGRYGSPLFQSTLVKRNADLSYSPDLATSYELSKDGLTWAIELRTDATFTDGTPVTASDVAFTFATAAKSGGLTDVTTLAEAKATGKHTLTLRLKHPQSTFINRLASLGIVPEKAHGAGYATRPIGSGPFKLVSWEQGQQLIVERNDDYYGTKPAFEKMTFLFSDEDATLAALRAGAIDVAGVPAALAGESIAGREIVAIASLDNRAISLPVVPAGAVQRKDGRPVGNDVTADVAVRRAINVAVNREELVSGILDGHGSPAYGPVDEAPWFNPETSLKGLDNNPEQAALDLEAAGWTDADGDGVREKDGVKASLTLWYAAGDSTRQNLSVAVADQLKKIGLDVTTQGGSWEEIERVMNAHPVLWGWGSQDPIEMYNLISSTQRGVEYSNPGYYANPEVDRALEAALSATDTAAATKYWKAAQVPSSGANDAPWAWLVNLDHTYYVNSCLDLGNSITEPHGHGWPVTANITEWAWTC